jgi:hypothetical protein
MMLAAVRPHAWDLPLFLHVLGAMVLVGAVATAALLAFVAWRRPGASMFARSAFWALLAVGVPAYVVMRIGAQWTYSKEGFSGKNDPTWVGIGFLAADAGLLLLLITAGLAFWWKRSGKIGAGRAVSVLASLYLVLLAVAWFAMSAKWG